MLTKMPMPETMRTEGLAVTLVMRRSELRTLLADNVDLVSGLFATLSSTPPGVTATDAGVAAAADFAELARSGLSPVEKVLALQRVPLFSRVAADEMRQLADVAQAVDLAPGARIFTESAAPALWLVLSGELALTATGSVAARTVRSGDLIGTLEVLSGRPLGMSAQVVAPGVALRLDREDLFSLLGERPELLRQIFSGMFRVDAARLSSF